MDAPHISKDKRYYKRFNFESVPMEEYEIRQLYGRKVQSKLVIDKSSVLKSKESEDDDEIEYGIEVDIYNDGEKMEENYKVNIYFIDFPESIKVFQSKNQTDNSVNFTRLDDNRIKASIKGNIPIYPYESLNVVRINFRIKKENLIEAFENIKIEIRLYYPNGEDLMESELGKMLKNFE